MHFTWFQLRFKALLALFFVMICAYGTAEPTVSLLPVPDQAVLGEVYPLEVELSWQGASDQYSSIAPQLTLSDWAEVNSVKTTTRSAGEQNTIRHTVQIRPLQAGQFTIPELLVPYFTPQPEETAVKADSDPVLYTTLSAGALTIHVIESSDSFVYLMSLVAIFLIMGALVWAYYRRQRVQVASTGHIEYTVPGIVHEAKKHRLDGYHYKFYQILLRGAGLLQDSPEKKQLQVKFEELTLATGYKGLVPTDEDMDGAIRDLEQVHRKEGTPSA